ncbi:MAG: glutathione S-transferase family protein, partial [Myxococcota bacterium]
MTNYKLVSFNLCPFVQRSVITLQEKNCPYDIEYIDLADRPDWFVRLSPFGKVPILLVDDQVLFESAVINEFIDETAHGPRLHPQDPLKRAQNRSWIEFGSALLVDSHRMMMAKDKETAQEGLQAIKQKLARVEKEIKGPFFNGDSFSLVDSSWAPALQRLSWCGQLHAPLQPFEKVPKVKAWTDA